MSDNDDTGRMLEQYANAPTIQQSRLPQRSMGTMMQPEPMMAPQVPAKPRGSEQEIRADIKAFAAAAGNKWYYRIPVRDNRTGKQDWQEGPTIKLANDVARIYGHSSTQCRSMDMGDAWEFLARFTDLEAGFSMERPYRQRKSQATMRGRDVDRQLDQLYQIGVSKAIRNVICNALQHYVDFAVEEAKKSLVNKIGTDIEGWRERTVRGLNNIPVEVARVERLIGRASKDWMAPDISRIISMMNSIADGMASVDDVFPPIARTVEAKVESKPEPEKPAEQPRPPRTVLAETDAVDDLMDNEDPVAVAYDRGVRAAAEGKNRSKAMPQEYREPSRQREATVFLLGFDGKPRPTYAD